MRILLVGASGLIGRHLTEVLDATDHQVRHLIRRPGNSSNEFMWNPETGSLPEEAITWADAVISLNGASLTKLPWTAAYRRQIVISRVRSTACLAHAIASNASPPRAWIAGSAVGFYGSRPGQLLTEDSFPGTGFLAETVDSWENATHAADAVTRIVNARTGVVLAGRGGALAPLFRLANLGLGGRIGTGHQYWPWIALSDEVNALIHLATDSQLAGPVNLVGPTPATALDVTQALARELHRPHLVPTPSWLLQATLGEAARGLLLADQRVTPRELLAEPAFTFAYPTAAGAVAAAVGARQGRR